jgi:RND family efflux transporter MFP subunit
MHLNKTASTPRFPLLGGLFRAAALSAAFALGSCGDAQKQTAAPPAPAVTVAKPVKHMVTDRDEYVGRFVAVDNVEVRARVSGYLEKVHFKDGQIVKQGDLLFTIDKRPFQNALDQAKGNLALARSNLTYAQSDLARAEQLVREHTVTEQVFEQRAQAKRNAEASVASNEAMVRQAELDLEFTELRAPIGGRIGDRRVAPGNLVAGGTAGTTTLLATIVSIDPIRFEFTVDEASFLRYERIANWGKDESSRASSIEVALKLIDEKEFDHKGRVDFVDNVIDRSTGTIRARAVIDNPDGIFTPGMFARLQVPGSQPYEALLIADAAIGTEQVRKFVYVVGADNVVAQRFVTLGDLSGDMRVVKEGLSPDDRVIVNGMVRARIGQKVTPQAGPTTPTAAAAPATQDK